MTTAPLRSTCCELPSAPSLPPSLPRRRPFSWLLLLSLTSNSHLHHFQIYILSSPQTFRISMYADSMKTPTRFSKLSSASQPQGVLRSVCVLTPPRTPAGPVPLTFGEHRPFGRKLSTILGSSLSDAPRISHHFLRISVPSVSQTSSLPCISGLPWTKLLPSVSSTAVIICYLIPPLSQVCSRPFATRAPEWIIFLSQNGVLFHLGKIYKFFIMFYKLLEVPHLSPALLQPCWSPFWSLSELSRLRLEPLHMPFSLPSTTPPGPSCAHHSLSSFTSDQMIYKKKERKSHLNHISPKSGTCSQLSISFLYTPCNNLIVYSMSSLGRQEQ